MGLFTNIIKPKYLVAICFCFNGLTGTSQKIYLESDLVFEHFDISSNLSNNIALKLFQDSQGILWIGTREGLNAYDGYDIKQFKDYVSHSSGLKGRWIYSISEDSFGNVWSGTYKEGINIFNRQSGTIKNFDSKFLGLPKQNSIVSITSMAKHEMIGATEKLLIYVTLNDDGSWLNHTLEDIGLNDDENILNLTFYNDQIIVQTNRRILLKGPDGIKDLISNEDIRSMKIKDNGMLWILTKDRIGTLNLINNMLHWIPFEKPETIDNYLDLDKDFDNNLWVATTNGILKLKIDDAMNVLESQHIRAPQNKAVKNVLVDPSNNVYFAAQGSGFLKLSWERDNYNYISLPEPYKDEYVYHGLEDNSGLYWVGSHDGVFVYNPQKKTFISFDGHGDVNLRGFRINDLKHDKEGQVWLSTRNGIARFDQQQKKFVFYGNNLGDSRSITHHLEMDKNSNIWYATKTGVAKWSQKENQVKFYDIDKPECIYIDKDNRLWSSVYGKGLFCYDISIGEPIQTKIHESTEFGRYPARSMISDSLDRLWYSSGHGIYVFDTKKEKIVNHLHRENLLDTDDIWYLIPNSEGNFWIKQVIAEAICINPYTFEVVNSSPNWLKLMGKRTGFAGPNSIDNKGIAFTDGLGGFFVYKPDSLKKNLKPPKILLTNIAINGKEVFGNILGSNAQNLEKLNYSKNSITFDVKGIDGDNPNKIKYAFRLLGQSDEWIYNSTRSVINYSGLVPNTYQFEVKAANKNLVWSDPEVLARFQIIPPWWKTNVAYLVYLLLVSGIIYTIYKIQLNRRLAESESKKLKEVDDFKNRFFANITHEFRTPLTVILGLSDKIEKKSASILKRNANQLLKLVNELLEIGKIESNFSKLNMTTQDMVRFSKYCLESLESLALEKAIQLKFHSNKDEILMSFDAEKMQLILNNLLSNAIKFTPQNGEIEICISEINKHVEIQVKDSGIGIPKDSLEKIFDRYYQVENKAKQSEGIGLGLALTRELVKLMNGTIVAKNNDTGGACFVVNLPIEISEDIKIEDNAILSHSETEIKNDEDQNIVLVIEDNQDVLDYTTSILEDSYQIITANNGKIGYEKAIEIIPDLIISDVMMPVMDGFEACEKLKTDFRTDHIPIVMLTAKADMGSKISGLRHGADAYISKPFNRGELLAHIDNLIKIREKLKEKYSQSILGNDDSKPKVTNKFLDNIKVVLLDHLSDDTYGIHEVCSEIGVSRAQFHRKLKALTGLSASIFIREIRLQKAYAMLKETELNISEIAYSVGFTDPNYFTKLFHEKYKLTPSQLKEAHY